MIEREREKVREEREERERSQSNIKVDVAAVISNGRFVINPTNALTGSRIGMVSGIYEGVCLHSKNVAGNIFSCPFNRL